MKYPELEMMEVGDAITMPWACTPGGQANYAAYSKRIRAVRHYAKTYGVQFHTYRTPTGLKVIRIV